MVFYVLGVLTGIMLMVAINMIGSWWLDRYFEERGRD